MHFSSSLCLTAAVNLLPIASNALNILMNNDDGFGSANIRELYRLLNSAGHNAWIVALVDNESATGDTEVLGPFVYTLSRTIGATQAFKFPNRNPHLLTSSSYAAIERSIPAIAFSGGNNGLRGYKEVNATTKFGYPDPATMDAQLSVDLVNQLVKKGDASQLLPYGYGISVNYPKITSFTDSSCVAPPFIQTRMTGGAEVDTAVSNETTGLFSYDSVTLAGVNTCINGDCSLPGETNVVDSGCFSSVSVFTVDMMPPAVRGASM